LKAAAATRIKPFCAGGRARSIGVPTFPIWTSSRKYIAIPDKREFGLGKPLALDFARECLPGCFDEVRYMFSKRGAYKKFRALLIRTNALDRWYDYESKATERALRNWCEFNSIEVAD
jgi:hypothetical protein